MVRVAGLWVVGLVTIVPLSAYRLLTDADRDEYAFLITIPLFWVFGFWGVVTPLMAAMRIHRLMSSLGSLSSSEAVQRALESGETEETVVDLMAQENGIPRFVARRLYRAARGRFRQQPTAG